MKVRLSKEQLNEYTNFLGFVAAIGLVLNQGGVISDKTNIILNGLCIALIGYLSNKWASASPTTSQLEDREIHR
jgi:hypothetical protein